MDMIIMNSTELEIHFYDLTTLRLTSLMHTYIYKLGFIYIRIPLQIIRI